MVKENNIVIYEEPNKLARPARVSFSNGSVVFHGYQEFILVPDSITVSAEDLSLQRKQELLAPFFCPRYLKRRTVLDLGANAGFFSFWALQNGAANTLAVDIDESYLRLVEEARDHLDFDDLVTVKANVMDLREPGDITLALALVHWIYSCTALFGSLDSMIERLAQLTKYMLIVEWIDPEDSAINFFHHLDWNEGQVHAPYTVEEFEGALGRHFARFEVIGEVSPSRRLYVAFKSPHEIDLSGPLPFIKPPERLIYCRRLCVIDGMEYWTYIYDDGGIITKQTSLDLAEREAYFLSQLDTNYFPKVHQTMSEKEYSVVVLEKIQGASLEEAKEEITSTQVKFKRFIQHCLALLSELRDKGINHRDIQEHNFLVRDGKPVLIDFGWATSIVRPCVSPSELCATGRPPDGSSCDVYSMGKLFERLNQHRYPNLDLVINIMTEPNASLRVTNLETLRILFTSVAEPRKSAAQDEIITTSARNKEKSESQRIATSELLEQISKRNRQLHWLKNQHASRKQQLSNYEHDVRAQIEELRKREAIISETQTALEEQTTWTKRSAEEIEARDAVIHELRAELEQRTACVERSAEEITQRDATISRLQIELDEQAAAWPKRFAEEVEARDTVIRELRAELEQGAACVKRSAEELTQRDATISGLQTEFDEQAAAWAKRFAEEVESRDTVIDELQGELEQRTALAKRSTEEVTHRDLMIREIQTTLNERGRALETLLAEVAQASKVDALRETTIHDLQAQLKNQTAWGNRVAEDAIGRDKIIREQQATLFKNEKETLALLAEHKSRQRGLKESIETLRVERDQAVQGLASKLAEAENTVALLRAQAAEKGQALDRLAYAQARYGIKQIVHKLLPSGARVLVVSRGDDDLLRLNSYQASHFPQTEQGEYAGHHPADSASAIDHLEALRARDAKYLVFPNTSFWWLDYYKDFQQHLDTSYQRIWCDQQCIIYFLSEPVMRDNRAPWPRRLWQHAYQSLSRRQRRDDKDRSTSAPVRQNVRDAVAPIRITEEKPGTNKHVRYQQLTHRLREVVQNILPNGARVIIVSKGDDGLLNLNGHQAWHFPQTEDGVYAGHHPADSRAAINHLETLRAKGGSFLLFPSTAFWWLEYYKDFRQHLEGSYQRVWSDKDCIIYRLSDYIHSTNDAPLARTESPIQESPVELLEQVDTFPPPIAYDVICFPIIDWHFRFQRPQQLLTQFARAGHRVFYLRTTFHQLGAAIRAQTIAENIYDLELPGPASLRLYQDEIDEQILEECMHALDDFRCRAGIEEAVCIVDLPFWAPLAVAAKKRWGWKTVYDCMDEHSGFSTNNQAMLQHEELLIKESDLVLATGRNLYEKASRFARQTLLLPNAADFEHFNRPCLRRPLADLSAPVIGYYGAISDWFDVEMICSAAIARPDWQFVLIGHTFGASVACLEQLRNVHLLGEKPYCDLPNYLHQFDVACIPFLLTPLIQATNPVKFYEYLSAGKPVVAVALPELALYEDYYYPVHTAEDFVAQVERALKEDCLEKAQARVELAKQNTWPDRYQKLTTVVPMLYGKVAIIIISFMQFEYLKRCLESIWAKTLYPNFEVIVVDNGARAEIVNYLQESAEKEARLKVILNGENLGFARANNIGIDAAGPCDYIVLLNDDTIVTRGWLGKIVHYLEDPRVGLVGPVTNWTGNEAKIEVEYEEIDRMDEFADRYVREHSGQFFDISMLAMYCVGFRKSLLDKIGLLDEQFGVGMFEDDDFSLRVRQAWHSVICAEDIFVHHWGKASFSRLDKDKYDSLFEENKKKFEEKWGCKWQPHQYRKQPYGLEVG